MMSCFVIAECGINHNGSAEKAMWMVSQAKEAGADAAKFQLFTALARPKMGKYILPLSEWRKVVAHGKRSGIPVFWSVFDFESVFEAKELGAPFMKLSFVERRNSRLIDLCEKQGFIRRFVSVDLYDQYDSRQLSEWEKLYCPNNGWSGYYPTEDEHVEWERYSEAARTEGLGWSCHCRSWKEPVIAAALGAKVVEKHFKIDDDCPDAECSISPEEFRLMVAAIRRVEK